MTWRQETEAEKAIAFEAIRPRLPDAWTLLEIVESASPPDEHDDPSFPGSPAWHDIDFDARDGWKVTIFYDGGGLDYITEMRSPDGLVIDPGAWPEGAPGVSLLRNWRAVGDLARLRAHRDADPVRTIDCTALGDGGEIRLTEEEADRIPIGGIEIVGGYVDWEASAIRRIPMGTTPCPADLPAVGSFHG